MFDDHELKIKLYLYPIFMLALGTLGLLNEGWEWFGVALYILAFLTSAHIAVVSVIRESGKSRREETYRMDSQRKLYEKVQNMTPEEKYVFGLAPAPKEVLVKIDKTKEVGNEFSQTWRKLPIAPYKLKVIAQAALNGEGFTVRKWAGDGKLLSREEWEAVHKEMVRLGILEQVSDDPRGGFMWTSFGTDVLAQILKDTL